MGLAVLCAERFWHAQVWRMGSTAALPTPSTWCGAHEARESSQFRSSSNCTLPRPRSVCLTLRTANHLALLSSGPDALVRLRAGVATTCGYPRPALPPAAQHSRRPRAQGYNGVSKGLMASFIFSASERFDRAVAEPGDNITNLLKGLSKEGGLGKLFAQLSTLAWAVAASQARPCQRRAARAQTLC